MSHIALVKQALTEVLPSADATARAFYQRLFELDPSLQPLFTGDQAELRRKFMDMLTAMIQGLDRLHTILPEVHQLGLRHAGYGVKPEHYATASMALLWAMEQSLGDGFSAEARAAWIEAFELLTAAMQAGSQTDTPRD